MNKSFQVENEQDFFARMRKLAKKLDDKEFAGSYENLSFEDPGEMERFLLANARKAEAARTTPVIALVSKKHEFFSGSFATVHMPLRGKVAAKRAERLVAKSKGALWVTQDENGKLVSSRLITSKGRKNKTRA